MWKKIEFAIVLLLLAVLIMMSNHLEEMVSSEGLQEGIHVLSWTADTAERIRERSV